MSKKLENKLIASVTIEDLGKMVNDLKQMAYTADQDSVRLGATKLLIDIYERQVERSKMELIDTSGETKLTQSQAKIYKKLMVNFDRKTMTEGDKVLLRVYCQNLDWYNQMAAVVNELGQTIVFKNGITKVRPEVSMMRSCVVELKNISKMLGLDTVSKMKIGIEIPTEDEDPMNELI